MTDTLLAVLDGIVPDRTAVRVTGEEPVLTGRQLAEGVETVAGALHGSGIRRGDRVAIVFPNGPEFIQLLLGVAALGAAAAPLNPAYTREECSFYLEDLEPRALVVLAGESAAARAGAPDGTIILDAEFDAGGVVLRREGALLRGGPFESAAPDDIALLLHTSGTTSRPKQVPLLHRNLMASARSIAAHYAFSAEDISFAVMPLFHVHGLVASVIAPLLSGGTVIAPRRLAPKAFWAALASSRVTWFSGSPTLLTMLLDQRPKSSPAPGLRFVRSCSAALSSELFERIEHELGVPVLQAYGMTETSHQIASNPLPPERHDARSVGVPTGTQVTTLDPAGRELPPGSPGEIAVRGPGVTPGYLNNPQANAAGFADGWFRTGDRGAVDADGYVTLEGRIKELIIRGGENISPHEVEEVLRRHPTVADAACFGLPDVKYGEVVGAAVVLREPTPPREIVDFCRERLAAFKVPQTVNVVGELPKTATGKVQRQQLVARFTESDA